MTAVPFRKMNALGNDFIVFDARKGAVPLSRTVAVSLFDRHTGVGCDNILTINHAQSIGIDARVAILDRMGNEIPVCANGIRCVAHIVMEENAAQECLIETSRHTYSARKCGAQITVDMGPVKVAWHDIPLKQDIDTCFVPLATATDLGSAVCCNVGIPQVTFFVEDIHSVDLSKIGPILQQNAIFCTPPNIGICTVTSRSRARLKVWEVGAGLTLACGSGACAAAVAGARRDLTGRDVEIEMERGALLIEWCEDGRVLMTGPVATSFHGAVDI